MHVLQAYQLHGWKDIDKNILFFRLYYILPYACEVIHEEQYQVYQTQKRKNNRKLGNV